MRRFRMSLANLDSRTGYGTDGIQRLTYPPVPGSIETPVPIISVYPIEQEIRVIVGRLGNNVRMSAPSLELVVEGKDIQTVANFVSEKLAPLNSVKGTVTHFMLKKYKEDGVVFVKKDKSARLAITY